MDNEIIELLKKEKERNKAKLNDGFYDHADYAYFEGKIDLIDELLPKIEEAIKESNQD